METALPSSVQSWLGNELEIRGIDSVIYSRYIIHLLLEDQDEDSTDYLEHFFNPRLDIKSKLKSHKKSNSREEKRKKAAIDCLQAVSEENCGIEKLVEELCNKLKELSQSSGSDDTDQSDSTPSQSDGSCSELEDPAERYYAAFPALTGQIEKSPISENCQHSLEIWKDNPWIKQSFDKQLSMVHKHKKTPQGKDEKKKYKKKYSPIRQERKKHTQEKPIPKPKTKPTETFHTRFMSWPRTDFIPVNPLDKQTSEEKKLCQQVENILKEMLLSDKSGKDRKAKEKWEYESDGFISPELQENAFWYTKQFAELINPVESRQRLYERHSCPFFHTDDVFQDPDTNVVDDQDKLPLEDDQFGLHDLMKNQELQSVAESVLQNVDKDFSKNEIDIQVPDDEANKDVVLCPFQSFEEIDHVSATFYDEKVEKPDPSTYENTALEFQNPYIGETPVLDLWSTSSWDNTSDPTFDILLLGQNEDNFQNYSIFSSEFEHLETSRERSEEFSLPSWMFSGSKVDVDDKTDLNSYAMSENYSQLWDINIWNKTHCLQSRSFLDEFDSTFDDFKSGLNHPPDKMSNRNSGVFNITLLNEGLDSFEMLEGENINTLIPKITFNAVDMKGNLETLQHESSEEHPHRAYDRSISLTDVHLLKSMRDDQYDPIEKLSKSFELIPSNNSAFKDVVPRKMTHVRSDSNICYCNYSTVIDLDDSVQQSKDEEEKKENLYLSPKTHFRPISAVVEDNVSDLNMRDLFGGYSSSQTQYQKYQDVCDSGDEDSFVPMFKVCSQHDKYIQTGTVVDEHPIIEDNILPEDQGRPPEIIEEEDLELVQDFDVYGYVDSLTASAQNTPQNVLDVACNTCCDSGYEEANDDEKTVDEKSNWLTVKENHRLRKSKTMQWPKQTGDDATQDCQDLWMLSDSDTVAEISSSVPDNVWSCNEDSNFADVFSFFTEDCDDLKIKDMQAERLSPCLATKTETDCNLIKEMPEEIHDDVTKVKLVIGKGKKVLQDIENCSKENTSSQPIYVKGYMPMPRVAVYSCELEKEWLDKESPQSSGKSAKSLKGIGRKPCSFFMEGSCKRSDCKFSHDLSSITCRFWEEGDCFKGDLCPFLHSYYVSEFPIDIKENVDDHFKFQEEEFPQLSNPCKKQKQRISKTEKLSTYVDSRKNYRTSKPKSASKFTEKTDN